MLFSQAYGSRRVDSSMITYSMQGRSKFHMQSTILAKNLRDRTRNGLDSEHFYFRHLQAVTITLFKLSFSFAETPPPPGNVDSNWDQFGLDINTAA